MNGLLEFAAKYFPDLEKIAEGGDAGGQEDELLKVLQMMKTKKEKKPTPQKKVKKTHVREGPGANFQRYPPRPILRPKWYLQPRCAHIQECCLQKKAAMPYCDRPKRRRTTVKPLKTGTIINNVSTALEKFKKKREKFLIYLQQLQDELTELNLPSLSKEDMFPKGKKRVKKEKCESKQFVATKSKKALKKKKLGKKKLSKKKPLVIENVIHLSSDSSALSFTDSENMY